MKNWKSILLLVVVFAAGVAVGVVGTRASLRHFMRQAMAQPERAQVFVERELAWKLRLDREQRAKLHGILSESRGQLREIRQQVQPQTVMVLSNANAQISAILTPEQQARFEDFKRGNFLFARPPAPPMPPRQP